MLRTPRVLLLHRERSPWPPSVSAVPAVLHRSTGSPASRRREAPLGRAALWFCVGLGSGILLTAAAALAATGSVRALVGASTGIRVLALAWPAVLVAAASALLVAGTLAGRTITVPRARAEALLRAGESALARVRRVRVEPHGSRSLVHVALDARRRHGARLGTRVSWRLDPLDARMLARGAVIPVRLDVDAPRHMVLDVRADSRASVAGVDIDEEFALRGIIRARLRSLRWSSLVAVGLGLLAGTLTVLLG